MKKLLPFSLRTFRLLLGYTHRLTSRRDIQSLNKDLEVIIEERKSRFKRFFSAKRHRAELQDVVTQLETARANYTASVLFCVWHCGED